MLNGIRLKTQWKDLTSYERFEQIATRIIMFFVSAVIVYSLVLVALELIHDFALGLEFMEKELLQDVFGSILTVLILLEFNHSIALTITKKSGAVQARTVVLIAILVIARKVVLLDFKAATAENLLGLGGMALAFGALYWLLGPRASDMTAAQNPDASNSATPDYAIPGSASSRPHESALRQS